MDVNICLTYPNCLPFLGVSQKIVASQKSLKNASFSFGEPLILRHTSSHNECITFHSTYQTMAGILNPHQVTTQRTIPSVCKKMAGKLEDCSNTISAGRHLQKPPASAGRRATERRNIEVSIGRSKGAAVFTARKSDKKASGETQCRKTKTSERSEKST